MTTYKDYAASLKALVDVIDSVTAEMARVQQQAQSEEAAVDGQITAQLDNLNNLADRLEDEYSQVSDRFEYGPVGYTGLRLPDPAPALPGTHISIDDALTARNSAGTALLASIDDYEIALAAPEPTSDPGRLFAIYAVLIVLSLLLAGPTGGVSLILVLPLFSKGFRGFLAELATPASGIPEPGQIQVLQAGDSSAIPTTPASGIGHAPAYGTPPAGDTIPPASGPPLQQSTPPAYQPSYGQQTNPIPPSQPPSHQPAAMPTAPPTNQPAFQNPKRATYQPSYGRQITPNPPSQPPSHQPAAMPTAPPTSPAQASDRSGAPKPAGTTVPQPGDELPPGTSSYKPSY